MKHLILVVALLASTHVWAVENCESMCSNMTDKMEQACKAKPDPTDKGAPKSTAKQKARCEKNVKDMKTRCLDECTKEMARD